jgi:quinol monooxygenase YgiN
VPVQNEKKLEAEPLNRLPAIHGGLYDMAMMDRSCVCSMKMAATGILFLALLMWSAPGGMAQNAAPRIYVISHVDVIPKFAADTAKLLSAYGEDSRKDAGAVRVDVLVEGGPNHFTLVELWESRAAYEAHVSQEHTRAFREKLHAWLGSPYDERLNTEVKP